MGISQQALSDAQSVSILQDAGSTNREKQKAFEDIYSRHQRQVGIYFLKNVGDDVVAEDLKMITFEKVHSSIDSFDVGRVAFSTWMYKIASNTLIDYKRKENFEELSIEALSGKTSEDNEGMEFQIASDSMTPEQEMVRAQNAKVVNDAIESIKNESIRNLMKMRYIDELSFKEIESLTNTNQNTLRVNAKRGKEMLEKILAPNV